MSQKGGDEFSGVKGNVALAEEQLQAMEELLKAGIWVTRATGEPPEASEWAALARAAEASGKEVYSVDAQRQAERGEE